MSFSLHSFQPLSALSWSQDGYAEFKMDTISNTKELQNQWWAQHKANSETKMQLFITPLVLYFETLLTPKSLEWWRKMLIVNIGIDMCDCPFLVMTWLLSAESCVCTWNAKLWELFASSSSDESVWGRSVITIGSVSAIDDTVRVTSRSFSILKVTSTNH